MPLNTLYTPWGGTLNRACPLPEYPRPQLRRESYLCLNGVWQYAVCDAEEYTRRNTGEITVPFSPESLLSGCDFHLKSGETLWYERTFTLPEGFVQSRVLLHFGAVDQSAEVYINDKKIGRHEGGYLPFSFDITDLLRHGENRLSVAVTDLTDGGIHAYGKQKYNRGGIWYTAQSGIWQTVWLESVPEVYVTDLHITPDFDGASVTVETSLSAPGDVTVTVHCGETVVAVGHGEKCTVALPDLHPWSPEDPFLYDLTVTAGPDCVESYFGMRKFSTADWRGHRVMALNNQPYFQTGLLDQGYWSDGLYTPPSDEAMIYDIQTMKDMGFNMLRKHIKIEPLRWYYHCDRLGMIVWQDLVSGGDCFNPLYTQVLPFLGIGVNDKPSRKFGRGDRATCDQFERDLADTVALLYNVPSLALWTLFNEGWGQFDAVRIAQKLRALDPTRLIDHASGWHDQGGGDLSSHHVYYRAVKLKNDGRRVLALTEFGGYSQEIPGHTGGSKKFGYRMYEDAEAYTKAVEALYRNEIAPLIDAQGLSAAVYTQVSDVEDELNGLLTYDRKCCKMDPARMRALNDRLTFK
jgi:hypothetical protein